MTNCKCGKCRLVNHASEEMCKNCCSKINKNWKPFDVSETRSTKAKKNISILPLVLLLPIGTGAYLYWNFAGKEQPKLSTIASKAPLADANTNGDRSVMPVALEQVNGQQSCSSVSSTVQGSKVITQANARVAEIEKLMVSETSKSKK